MKLAMFRAKLKLYYLYEENTKKTYKKTYRYE